MRKANRTYRSISWVVILTILCTLIPGLNGASVNAATEDLLSAGKTMSTSSGTTASMANDGDGDTFWDGIISDEVKDVGTEQSPTAWLQMDLGVSCLLTKVVVKPYYLDGRYYNYYVYISNDGASWTKIGENLGTESATEEGDTYFVTDNSAKYIRVSVFKNSVPNNFSAHIRELEVYGVQASDSELVAADKENLQVGFSDNNSPENVVKNVTLPTTGTNGSTISWESSMPEIISITTGSGVVVRPQDEDKVVKLTATLTKGSAVDTKEFSLIVKRIIEGEQLPELISQGKPTKASYSAYPKTYGPDKVNDGIINGDNYWDSIRGAGGLAWIRIDLMSAFTIKSINVVPYYDGLRYYNYFIEVSTDGENWTKVGEKNDTIPSPSTGDIYELTDKVTGRYVRVSMTKNSADNYSVHISEIKVYGFKDDVDAVAEDKAALEIGYTANDNAQSITKNINLTTLSNCGSTIIWSSSDPSVIDNAGNVTRPYDTDVQVTLTATISKGTVTDTKSFNVNVKHLIPISVDKPATASSIEPGNPASNAVDNNDDTYWSGYIDGTTKVASLTVDLLNVYDLYNINIRPYSDGVRYYNYYFEGSIDGISWETLGTNDSSEPTALTGKYYNVSSKARYIRLNVTKFYTGAGFDYMAHIKEIKIYGNKTDEMSVLEDKAALELEYAQGDSSDNVRMNVILPTQGTNESNISWESSNPDIISNNGKINTSTILLNSANATLTATITKGNVSDAKSFDITIMKPISQGKPVYASSSVTGHGPELVNDGNPSTYLDSFRSSDGTAICQIDLEENYKLDGINIANFADGTRYYKYYAKISTDGTNWIPVLIKNDETLSTDDGCYFNVKGNARYIRIYTTFNSVSEDEIHINEVRVFGEKINGNAVSPFSINNFETDKNAYKIGDTAKVSLSIKNTTNAPVEISAIKLTVAGLTERLYLKEYVIEQNATINEGQSLSLQNKDFWNIVQEANLLGAYGLWISTELADGSVYHNYGGFIRIIDDNTLLNYDVKKFDYNGLNVYALDGGMSAEASVEKSIESLDSAVSHSWYIQSNGGPDFVYASKNFLKDSIEKTVDLYNDNLGADTQFDTVILATGNCGVNYLSTITKAPVLPVQFLVTADTYKELREVVDAAKDDGIPCYSTLGHDLSMKKGVAWVKLLDLPQAYKDFLVQHKVKNIIFAATENAGGGESRAKKVIEHDTDLDQTNSGDIFIMYPNGYSDTGLELDERELASCLRDYKEVNLEQDFRDFSDWESGMIQPQVDKLALSAKNTIGNNAKILQVAGGDAKALYDYATYTVAKFYEKNQENYDGNAIKGIVINPYLIAHPAYEIYNGYLPILLWQGSTNGSKIVNNLVNVVGKGAIERYFPNIDYSSDLKYWIDYTLNFGGEFQANEIKNALVLNGISQSQIVENIYTKDEIWNPDDGMDAPVEQIAQDIIQNGNQQEMKSRYSQLKPLSIEELVTVAADCADVRTALLVKPDETGNGGGNNHSSTEDTCTVTVTGSIISTKPALNRQSAVSELTSQVLEKAFENSEVNIKGEKIAKVIVEQVKGAKEYVLQLPTLAFQSAESNKKLQIETPVSTVVLPSNVLKGFNINKDKVELCIVAGDKSTLTGASKDQIGDKPVVELYFKVDGKTVAWENSDAAVTVSVDLKPSAEELKKPEHLVVLYIDNDGKVSAVPNGKYDVATGKVTFTTTHFSTFAVAFVNKTFTDIGQFGWAKKQIEVLASKGIISGVSNTEYYPASAITRADFLSLLMNTLGLTQKADSSFDDVKESDYYYDAVATAKKLGITNGTGNNKFNPKAGITRQDMIVLAERALKIAKGYEGKGKVSDLNRFRDSSEISKYAAQSIADFVQEGLISGTGNSINPKKNTTRAEAAVVLYKIYDMDSMN